MSTLPTYDIIMLDRFLWVTIFTISEEQAVGNDCHDAACFLSRKGSHSYIFISYQY